MAKLSDDQTTTSRNSHSLVLQELVSFGQVPIAKALEVDESTVSRLKNGQLVQFTQMLSLLDLKVAQNSDVVCPTGCIPIKQKIVQWAWMTCAMALGQGPLLKELREQYEAWFGISIEKLPDA